MKVILFIIGFFLMGSGAIGYGQTPFAATPQNSPLEMDTILKQGPEYDLINPLVGNWKAVQTIYSKDNGKILVRDTFRVERKMVGNFLQEIMEPMDNTRTNAFTRIAYLNYNRTYLRWEYIVLDTRYPVMMFETSAHHQVSEDKSIHLYLDAFVMPPFLGKEYTGLLTKEHRIINFTGVNTYVHKQYWTLPAGKEFLAIEYVFTRR